MICGRATANEPGKSTSGWAKLIKSKEPELESTTTSAARATLTQTANQQSEPVQSADKEALVIAFGNKKVIPQPSDTAKRVIKEKPTPPKPKVVIGNVMIEAGKKYNLRLITSGQGHYVLEVTLDE